MAMSTNVVPVTYNDGSEVPFCSSCDFGTGEGSRRCRDCLCALCGCFDAPTSVCGEPARLMECKTCSEAENSFGITRVHTGCWLASTELSLVCNSCQRVVLSKDAPQCQFTSPAVVKTEVVEDDSALLSQPIQPVTSRRHGPNLLRALLSSDPRTCTFDVLHFGALRQALLLGDGPSASAVEIVQQLPTFPKAALSVKLDRCEGSGHLCFTAQHRKRSHSNESEEPHRGVMARRRQAQGLLEEARLAQNVKLDVSTQRLADYFKKKRSGAYEALNLNELMSSNLVQVLEAEGATTSGWARRVRDNTMPTTLAVRRGLPKKKPVLNQPTGRLLSSPVSDFRAKNIASMRTHLPTAGDEALN